MKSWLFALAVALALPARAEVVLRDDAGNTLRLAAPARRIVALAPHLAETLFAAGAGERLVGTVSHSDYPPQARAVPRLGDAGRVDLEAVAALKPDLVLAWQSGNPAGQIARLRSLGVPVFVVEPRRLDDVADQIERLGLLAGSEAAAAQAAAAYRARLAALAAAQRDKAPVRVFYQIWDAPLITVGGRQIISDLIQLCGGRNVFASLEAVAPAVSVEAVLAADPEVIIASLSAEERSEALSGWKRWPRLTAARRGNLVSIPPDLVQRHTPRLLDGAERLCKALDEARAKRSRF
jgi:iron complex transport system substrate-binding protein